MIAGLVQMLGTAVRGFTGPRDMVDSGNGGCSLSSQATRPLNLLATMQPAVGPRGVERLDRASLVWNFLLDCLTEGKNVLFALLIVIPCEIKRRKDEQIRDEKVD